jgi:hypothetical protein
MNTDPQHFIYQNQFFFFSYRSYLKHTRFQCTFTAPTKKGAGMHALNEHMEKTFICDLCGEGFVTERSLHNHTSYHHLKAEKIYMMQNTRK